MLIHCTPFIGGPMDGAMDQTVRRPQGNDYRLQGMHVYGFVAARGVWWYEGRLPGPMTEVDLERLVDAERFWKVAG